MALTEAVGPAVARVRAGSALLGPAFVAAVAYVDPGNVASNISAGAQFGYLLVWVIVVANVMAALVQYLSAKLGLVTGMSLPEALRERMPRTGRLAYWAQAELVAMATDLAERKLKNIATTGAAVCATGNVGCAMQIQSEADARGQKLTVVHPVELLHRAVFGERSA